MGVGDASSAFLFEDDERGRRKEGGRKEEESGSRDMLEYLYVSFHRLLVFIACNVLHMEGTVCTLPVVLPT